MAHYMKPGRLEALLMHGPVAWLARRGISVYGSRQLAVRGRKSGEWQPVPVNPLTYEGERYLVSVRGKSQWVRNLRAAGECQLHLGRKIEPFTAVEVADGDKAEVLRAYLERWGFEVKQFFEGVGPKSSDEQLRAIAAKHPVFRLTAKN